ncbi:MAG: hypothetical protein GY774_30085, partial [Planctomycetes bacterium]|nr:hypothetical protein [Planctomycetota bacterium]
MEGDKSKLSYEFDPLTLTNNHSQIYPQFQLDRGVFHADNELLPISFSENVTGNDIQVAAVPPSCTDPFQLYLQAAKVPSTPLKPHVFCSWLEGYDDEERKILTSNLVHGIRLASAMPPPTNYTFYNHPSAIDSYEKVSQMIKQGIALGIISGPYNRPPPLLIVSPLAAIPKKNTDKMRIIHNLSYPYGASVNSHTPPEFCRVVYETIDDCIKIILGLGRHSLVSKTDLSNAYFCLPIHPFDYRFLGFTWDTLFYFGKSLPMGSGVSCKQFERFSVAIQWVLTTKLGVETMSHILDDFIFFGPPNSNKCSRYLCTFLEFARSIGLPIAEHKTVQPSTRVERHGLLVDTDNLSIAIPEDKKVRALSQIDSILASRK